MVHPSVIESSIAKLGFRPGRWFKPEIRELEHVLMDDEEIISLACGRYYGSFALLVATDKRLLLVDKRVFFTSIQDTRYDMISEIDYNSQALGSTVTIHTMNKIHKFNSLKHKRQLRELTTYVQRRVWEFRQQQSITTSQMPRFTVAAVPQSQPTALQPVDLYAVTDEPAGHLALTGQVVQAARKIGPAATQAAHLNQYSQGSLITHRPLSGNLDY